MPIKAMHPSYPYFWFHSGTHNVAINVKVGEKGKRMGCNSCNIHHSTANVYAETHETACSI
jgi:hypothetical protein